MALGGHAEEVASSNLPKQAIKHRTRRREHSPSAYQCDKCTANRWAAPNYLDRPTIKIVCGCDESQMRRCLCSCRLKSLLQVEAQGPDPNEKCSRQKSWKPSKIPPGTSPKEGTQFSTPRCAMEVSYCRPVILELRHRKEGKYEEEEKRRGKGGREGEYI